MTSKTAQWHDADRVYEAVFADAPCPFLVLTPELRIVEGNPAYLAATAQLRDSLVGRHMFEAFPDNPDDPHANGVENLAESFECAMRSGSRHLMPLQRYDVQDTFGRWQVKYWKPANWPVYQDGRLIAVVHHVMDVTEQTLTHGQERSTASLDLMARADLSLDVARRLRAVVTEDLAKVREQHEAWVRARRGRST